MNTEEEKKSYWAVYTCGNCGTEMWVRVVWGTPMPYYSTDVYSIEHGYAESAPKCKYCGCRDWSNGKKPKL